MLSPKSKPFFANALSRPRVLCYPTVRPTRSGLERERRRLRVIRRRSCCRSALLGFSSSGNGGGRSQIGGKNNLEEPQQKATRVEMVGCKAVSVPSRQKSAPCISTACLQMEGRKWFNTKEAGERSDTDASPCLRSPQSIQPRNHQECFIILSKVVEADR